MRYAAWFQVLRCEMHDGYPLAEMTAMILRVVNQQQGITADTRVALLNAQEAAGFSCAIHRGGNMLA